MTLEETRVFRLVDHYSRDRYQCFVTEMFLSDAKTEYTLCFRPIGVDRDSPHRHACRYLRLEAAEVEAAAGQGRLIASITEKLDKELGTLDQC